MQFINLGVASAVSSLGEAATACFPITCLSFGTYPSTTMPKRYVFSEATDTVGSPVRVLYPRITTPTPEQSRFHLCEALCFSITSSGRWMHNPRVSTPCRSTEPQGHFPHDWPMTHALCHVTSCVGTPRMLVCATVSKKHASDRNGHCDGKLRGL